VRLVMEHRGEYPSEWAAIISIAEKLLWIRSQINYIARAAWLASAASSVLLAVAAILAVWLPDALTSVTALLLVPPAALAAWAARPTEPLVSSGGVTCRLVGAMRVSSRLRRVRPLDPHDPPVAATG
jgi:hypothetical protein